MSAQNGNKSGRKKIVATYEYTDPTGHPAFEVVRFAPKDFRVRHKNEKGQVVWQRPKILWPYRAHEVSQATSNDIVWIVEGEKDVETMRGLKFIATCNPFGQGAGKWKTD